MPQLPYPNNALAPYISEETIDYHYGKHHKAYVTNLNGLIEQNNIEDMSLEALILNSKGPLFNNAAQAWNHTFYWHCMSPQGGQLKDKALASAIDQQFGSFDAFKAQFTEVAMKTFGSGWAWLVKTQQGALDIISTGNADTPVAHSLVPLLTCDVWEHAYYIDCRNARAKYIENFWNLVHWDFVAENFAKSAVKISDFQIID